MGYPDDVGMSESAADKVLARPETDGVLARMTADLRQMSEAQAKALDEVRAMGMPGVPTVYIGNELKNRRL